MNQKTKQATKPNIGTGLLAFHAVLTRGIDNSIEQLNGQRSVPPGEGRQGYADYLHSLSSLLHAHHVTEDEVIFPYLEKIIPDAPYDQLRADHVVMEKLIISLDEEQARWRAGHDTALDVLVESLSDLDGRWHPHITIEEFYYDPAKLGELIEDEEHVRLLQLSREYSMKEAGPDYLVMPFVLFNLPPDVRAVVAAGLPPVVMDQLVPVTWKDKWAPMKPFLLD
jgi:hypothetical protein